MLDSKNPYNGVINQNGYNTNWPREHDLRGREIGAKAGIQRIEKPHLTDGRLEKIAKDAATPSSPSSTSTSTTDTETSSGTEV
jgi:hypothetical protein